MGKTNSSHATGRHRITREWIVSASKQARYTSPAYGLPKSKSMIRKESERAEMVCIAVQKAPDPRLLAKAGADTIASACCAKCGVPLVQSPRSIARHNRKRHGC